MKTSVPSPLPVPASASDEFPVPNEPTAGRPPTIPVLENYFRDRWQGWSADERTRFLDQLKDEKSGRSPLVEPSPDSRSSHRAVTFFHESQSASAVILSANSLLNHLQLAASEFDQLQGSDLWALSYLMPADWECAYRITVHTGAAPAPWRTESERRPIRIAADAGGPDPLNPTVSAGMNGGPTSVVRLPQAPATPWLADATPDASASSPVMGGSVIALTHSAAVPGLDQLTLGDSASGRQRTVWLYSPPAGTARRDTPLLLLHDGQVWAKYLNLKASLDAAITAGVVPALYVAMIDSLDGHTRSVELSGPTGSVDFVANDLLPVLRQRLPIRHDAAGTIVSGASYGGLAALWQVARYPHLVGVALAQSPSLWRYDLYQPLRDVLDRVVVRLQAGIYEAEIHEPTKKLFTELLAGGADVEFQSITGGHDWAWWNPWLIHGLSALLKEK